VNEKRNSASISGAGKIGGGTYDRVTISGAGKVTGDLEADELRISGAGKVDGAVRARMIVVSGSTTFAADVHGDEMRVSGSARIDGRAEVKELKCSGTLRVENGISADYLKSSGHLRVGADAGAEIFKASGGFQIEGLLSADHIEINLGGRCTTREIGGEKIAVRRGGWRDKGILLDGLIKLFTGGGAAELHAQLIEGDEIYLEDTIAKTVRGKNVELGPGCEIGTVEYSENLRVHPDAEVEKKLRV
jgi:cytoskeletal protein CcmA (bactofilin family)